jgi:hypothetical protein
MIRLLSISLILILILSPVFVLWILYSYIEQGGWIFILFTISLSWYALKQLSRIRWETPSIFDFPEIEDFISKE